MAQQGVNEQNDNDESITIDQNICESNATSCLFGSFQENTLMSWPSLTLCVLLVVSVISESLLSSQNLSQLVSTQIEFDLINTIQFNIELVMDIEQWNINQI